jgi:hypothetical protein
MFLRALALVGAAFFFLQAQVRADIYSVTTTADSGPGSLRQAILDANAHPNSPPSTPDRIHFAIPGSDFQTIFPPMQLPYIMDPVFIDGFTQPGAFPNTNPVGQGLNPSLKIELDGVDIVYGNGLTVTCGDTTIRGLIISRFDFGIVCNGGSGNVITGNFIGTDRTGTFAPVIFNLTRDARQILGVVLQNCRNSHIGGRDPALRNLLAGNEFADILITGSGSTGSLVEGNLFGTKATGMTALQGAGGHGVHFENGASENLIGGTVVEARNVFSSSETTGGNYVGVSFEPSRNGTAASFANLIKGNFFGLDVTGRGVTDSEDDPSGFGIVLVGHDNVIGGPEPGAGNVISGNRVGGILIGGDSEGYDATNNLIQGNFIGTDESGLLPLGNGYAGIRIWSKGSGNIIGGTESGAGNRIAFTVTGVFADPDSGSGITARRVSGDPMRNAILGNLIYGNAKLGIDLGADGVTPNDPGDTDVGPNSLQNYPVLTSADFQGSDVRILGRLESRAFNSYRIEFFGDAAADDSMFGEGKVFLGASNVMTGADGTVGFEFLLHCPAGTRSVTATATNPDGNTSEFSRALSIAGTSPGQLLNISTRLSVQTAENVLIGGFIITGIDPKKVLVRAIGPSLSSSFNGVLPDPTLELFQDLSLLASNDNWRDTQQSEIEATGLAPSNDLESAIVRTLTPGAYTAVVRGQNNTTGIGLVEVYDLDQAVISELANISTRGLVESGDNVMIGGLIVRPDGGASATVVVRAIGPTLTNFGISGVLQDPTLELVNSDGLVIRSNNDWRESQQAQLETIGLQPGDGRESALIQVVAPGNYTAIVRGVGGTTGVALVEVYHIQ